MAVARRKFHGTVFHDPSKAYNGYTLLAPLGGEEVVLIDMQGRVVHKWQMENPPALHGELLPSGNLLYAGHKADGPLEDFFGAGGELVEVDWDGKVVWKYQDPYLHHTFLRLYNDNTLVLKWVEVPEEIAAKVRGGLPGTEKDGVMWSDSLEEVHPSGKVVWQWKAYEHLDPEKDYICPLCRRDQWTMANSLDVLPDGNILVCFSRINTLAIIEKETGNIKWKWGSGELSHPDAAVMLRAELPAGEIWERGVDRRVRKGDILFLDKGIHVKNLPLGASRLVELNPKTNEIDWTYLENPLPDFYTPRMGNCQRLPNGDTLVNEGDFGRIFELSPNKEFVWEYVSPYYHTFPFYGRNNYIFRAFRYGPFYKGLEGANFESVE